MVLAPPPAAESELLEISNVLLSAALQDRTACHVTAALSDLLDEPVFLLTRDFHTWAKALPREPADPFIAATDVLGGVPREVVGEWEASGDVAGLWVADRAVTMPAGAGHPRLVLCPIRASGEPSGYVMIPAFDPDRDDVKLASAQHLAVVAGLNLLRLRAFNAVEEQTRSSLVYALIDGSFTSQDELLERAAIAGFRHALPHVAFVIESQAPVETLARTAGRFLSTEERPAFVADLAGRAVAVIEWSGTAEARARAEMLRAQLAGALDAEVWIGAGSPAATPSDVVRSYREAVRALKLVASNAQPVAFHEEARLFTLLDAIPEREAIERYCQMILGPLYAPADASTRRLRATVEVLAAHGYNQAKAAREMGVHKNTVRYQVGRIGEIAGLDLAEPRHQLEATLAMQAGRFLHAVQGDVR